jgi:hypothetical protein
MRGGVVRVWQPHTALSDIAVRIAVMDANLHPRAPENPPVFYFVYGEPGLLYHLRRVGLRDSYPIDDLRFPEESLPGSPTVYLLTGPHAHRNPDFGRQIASRFRPVATYTYQPSDVVLLNLFSPGQLTTPTGRPREEVRLYRLQ